MFTRYHPRSLTFLEVAAVAGHRLEFYAIRYGEQPLDRGRSLLGTLAS